MRAAEKFSVDELVFKSLYYRYKKFIVPVTTILVCLLLIWLVITPQMQQWFATQDEIAVDTSRLKMLKQNVTAISLLDAGTLDSVLARASTALPTEKDFAGILNAITQAGASSGVSVGDYNFQIGDIQGKDTKPKGLELPLQLTINIKGSLDDTKRFIAALKNQLPLSDTISIIGSSNKDVALSVIFYYAPLPKITFQDDAPLTIFTAKEEAFLDSLTSQQTFQPEGSPPIVPIQSLTPTSTPSITSTPSSQSAAKK